MQNGEITLRPTVREITTFSAMAHHDCSSGMHQEEILAAPILAKKTVRIPDPKLKCRERHRRKKIKRIMVG